VARGYHASHPNEARVAVGDLSRPHGGNFGPQFGYIGHVSHQNGLDVDVYYPRADGRERAPRDASEIDPELSQELLDRFLEAGASTIFVGPNTHLTGPAGVVMPLANHDNHMHVRID
jgi:murein endopeptidase